MKIKNGIMAAAVALLVPGITFGGAFDVTGLWYNRNESGWGMNVMQQNTIVFITIFVQGSDTKPTWFVGPSTTYVAGTATRFTGPLYTVPGPYFGGAFNPAAVSVRQVGTVTFDTGCSGCNPYSKAQLNYTVDGVAVSKVVELQAWQTVVIPASSSGVIRPTSLTTCAGTPTVVAGANFTYSGTTLTVNDSNGVRYQVSMAGVPQYGTQFYGPTTVSISGVSVSAGSIILEAQAGTSMTGIISAAGPGNCVASYAFVALIPF